MVKGKQKTILLIAITLLTLVLGVIAVVTAYRLRQLATVPVAPNVPQSQPYAATTAEPVCTKIFTVAKSTCSGFCNSESDCSTGFTCSDQGVCINSACAVELQDSNCQCPQTQAATVTCGGKFAYYNDDAADPGDYTLTDALRIGQDDTVDPGEVVVYAVRLTSSETTGTATVTDPLPNNVTFVDAMDGCAYQAGSVTCSYTGAVPYTLAYRVRIADTAAAGSVITNTATVTAQGGTTTECTKSLQLAAAVTPTPPIGGSPTATPRPTATPTPRPTATPTSAPTTTPTPTTPPIGGANPTATPQPTVGVGVTSAPTPTSVAETTTVELPQAGVGLPSIFLLGLGGLLMIGGLALILGW